MSDFGLEVYGPDNSSVVWSSNIRATNVLVLSSFTLDNSTPSQTFSCPNADETSNVLIKFFPLSFGGQPPYGVTVSNRTSTSFTISKQSQFTSVSAYVIAVRIA